VIWDIDLNHFCKRFVIWTCDLICDLPISAVYQWSNIQLRTNPSVDYPHWL